MNRNLLTQTDARGCITTLSYDGLNRLTDKVYSGSRIAMRVVNTRYWLFSDHLGSTAITANSSGTSIGELRYKAWGESRYSWGTTYTKRHFTGQYQESTLGGLEGLYFYNSRWYDSFVPGDNPLNPTKPNASYVGYSPGANLSTSNTLVEYSPPLLTYNIRTSEWSSPVASSFRFLFEYISSLFE
jgi:hypothetical protein